MDPITSPDPTPLWREGDYPLCGYSANRPRERTRRRIPTKKPGEGDRVDLIRGDFIVLVFLWRLIDKTPEKNGVN